MPAKTINRALMLERKREWMRRQSMQGKFEASFVSLDALTDRIDPSKLRVLSDGGAGAEAIVDAIDGETPETLYERRLRWARQLIRRNLPESLEVFNLIVENRTNRKDSICAMMLERALAGWLQNNGIGST